MNVSTGTGHLSPINEARRTRQMEIMPMVVDAMQVTGVEDLDPIHVFWVNVRPGSGHVTITCYGSAWTAYFGAMAGLTIQQFFAEVSTDYLVPKLGITPHLKATKRDHRYLTKIIDAVKLAMAQSTAPEATSSTVREGEEKQ